MFITVFVKHVFIAFTAKVLVSSGLCHIEVVSNTKISSTPLCQFIGSLGVNKVVFCRKSLWLKDIFNKFHLKAVVQFTEKYEFSLIGNINQNSTSVTKRQELSVPCFPFTLSQVIRERNVTLIIKEVQVFFRQRRNITEPNKSCIEKLISRRKEWKDLQNRYCKVSEIELDKRVKLL